MKDAYLSPCLVCADTHDERHDGTGHGVAVPKGWDQMTPIDKAALVFESPPSLSCNSFSLPPLLLCPSGAASRRVMPHSQCNGFIFVVCLVRGGFFACLFRWPGAGALHVDRLHSRFFSCYHRKTIKKDMEQIWNFHKAAFFVALGLAFLLGLLLVFPPLPPPPTTERVVV